MRYKLLAVLLSFAVAVPAQKFLGVFYLHNNPEPVVQSVTRYNNATKSRERVYINKDYCSCMVVRKGARYYNVIPGENIIESRPMRSQAMEGNYAATEYRSYRGIFPKKEPKAGFYAMPLAQGEKVVVDPNIIHFKGSEREENYLSFLVQNNDTVYAMRGGTACLTGNEKGVVINHTDETFAVYYHMRRAFVKPGEVVEVGQPVGLASEGKVYVGFVYLDEKYFKQKEVAVEYPYTHFVPQIWNGSQYVRYEKVTYVAVPALTDELVTQDMTKYQKKRYLKNKPRK